MHVAAHALTVLAASPETHRCDSPCHNMLLAQVVVVLVVVAGEGGQEEVQQPLMVEGAAGWT